MCDHLRTKITQPDKNGISIKSCLNCPYTEQVVVGFYQIDDLLRTKQLKARVRSRGDYAGNKDGILDYGRKMPV